MPQSPIHPLDYASPDVPARRLPMFRTVSVMFAVFGIAVNIALMAMAISNAHDVHIAYRNLQKDSQYYSRPRRIAPAPRRPVRLWAAQAALMMSTAFGLLLAIDLLTATAWLSQERLESRRRLERYVKWKTLGALATGLLFLWAGTEHYFFWVTSTQHGPVGSGPPAMLAALVLAGAILPQRWVRRGLAEVSANSGSCKLRAKSVVRSAAIPESLDHQAPSRPPCRPFD